MAKDKEPSPIAMRLPPELLRKVDALTKKLAKHPDHQLHRISRSYILRLSVQKGLEELERKYP